MFLLIPWRVDVPQDRWPVMNWLILLALVGGLRPPGRATHRAHKSSRTPRSPRCTPRRPACPPAVHRPSSRPKTRRKSPASPAGSDPEGLGSQGAVRVHVAARRPAPSAGQHAVPVGLRQRRLRQARQPALPPPVRSPRRHGRDRSSAVSRGSVLGASGAINGVVGMYLVLFYQNEITCLFAFWLILPMSACSRSAASG